MGKNKVIVVQNINITVSEENFDDYICITDIAKAKVGESRGADVVKNWMRNRATLEFLGTWEQIYNPAFKVVEFDHFKSEAGLHTFVLSVSEWIEKTEAIGLFVKRGKYGGTYAHKDIAFEFASAISPVFKLYLIKEFQRLKEAENDAKKIEWDAKRFLSKNNYLIQTDAVQYLIDIFLELHGVYKVGGLGIVIFGDEDRMYGYQNQNREAQADKPTIVRQIGSFQWLGQECVESLLGKTKFIYLTNVLSARDTRRRTSFMSSINRLSLFLTNGSIISVMN